MNKENSLKKFFIVQFMYFLFNKLIFFSFDKEKYGIQLTTNS